jgi:hypothetical protein
MLAVKLSATSLLKEIDDFDFNVEMTISQACSLGKSHKAIVSIPMPGNISRTKDVSNFICSISPHVCRVLHQMLPVPFLSYVKEYINHQKDV